MKFAKTRLFPGNEALPPGWRLLTWCRDGGAYTSGDGLIVVSNTVTEPDGSWWLHVSVSRDERPPSLQDLAEVKRVFVGGGRMAFQVFAPEPSGPDAPYCVHLWAPLESAAVPGMLKAS